METKNDDYQLQLCNSPKQHDLALSCVEQDNDGFVAASKLDPDCLVFRSPYLVACRPRDPKNYDPNLPVIMLAMICDKGLLTQGDPNYNENLWRMLKKLDPVESVCMEMLDEFCDLFIRKLQNACFSSDRWPMVLLGMPSILPYSCAPNLDFYPDDTLQEFYFFTIRPTGKGERFTICYQCFPIDDPKCRPPGCKCDCCVKGMAPSALIWPYPLRTKHCWWCGDPEGKPCKCQRAHYCSLACQRADRFIHKTLCFYLVLPFTTGKAASDHVLQGL